MLERTASATWSFACLASNSRSSSFTSAISSFLTAPTIALDACFTLRGVTSIRQHPSACVRIRQHAYAYVSIRACFTLALTRDSSDLTSFIASATASCMIVLRREANSVFMSRPCTVPNSFCSVSSIALRVYNVCNRMLYYIMIVHLHYIRCCTTADAT